jgi:drug/metabolite transporter (DMT)-like permease
MPRKNGWQAGHEHAAMNAPKIDNIRGALWMAAAAFVSACNTLGIKILGTHLPAFEVAFMRCVAGLFALTPFLVRHGLGVYRTTTPKLHIIRIFCSALAIIFGVYGVSHLHLTTAVSLGFTRPLFMIILAIVILHEVVGWRRITATVVGFFGVLLVLGPTDVSDFPAAGATLASAAFLAGAFAVIRHQSAFDSAATIMCWAQTGICFVTVIPALLVWQTPTMQDYVLALALGLTGVLSQYMMVQAFMYGEATVVNPLDYTQIIYIMILGYLFYTEVPTVWTVVGTGVIIGSTLYIVLRETRLKAVSSPSRP